MKLHINHLYIVIILVLIIFLGFFSYSYYRKLKQPIAPVINAIPEDAILIAEFKTIYSLWNAQNESNEIWTGLQQIDLFKKTQRDLNFINTIINLNQEIKNVVSSQKSFVSLHISNAGKAEFLYLCNVPVSFDVEKINEMLKDSGIKDIKKSKKDKSTIFNATTSTTSYYYIIKQGVFIGSVSKELVEKSVDQLDNATNISMDANFVNISSTAGKKVDANIYINYQNLSNWATKSANTNSIINVGFLKEIGKWTELDLMIKNKQLLLNGYTSVNNSFLDIFKDEPPQETGIASVLPEKTISFTNVSFTNYATYHSRYKNYLKSKDQLINYEKEFNNLNLRVKFNLRDNFIGWMGKSYAIVILKNNIYSPDNIYTICQVSDINAADSSLKAIASASQENIGNDTKNKIQIPGLLKSLIGNICPFTEETWFETANDYVIFGNSKQALNQYKNAILNGEILANSKEYISFVSTISNQSNIFTYFNFDYAADFTKNTLNQLNNNNFNKNFSVLQGFHKASIQYSFTDNRFYTTLNIGFSKNENIKETTEIEVVETTNGNETMLDNQIANQPYLVKNTTDNEKNLLVFDISNKLYCVDKEGNIKWKLTIDGKLLSKIYVVDYLKNNRNQYLFNTENSIYLVDAKGKIVDNYPVKLSKKATSGLCLIDYEKKKEYRILIPTSDKKISYFNIKGNLINDFKSPVLNDLIITPPQHIIFGGKDNILISDKSGNFKILDRKGNERLKVKSPFHKNPLSRFYYDGKYLITSDISNNIKYISSKGEVENKIYKNINGNAHFIYEDYNNDGNKDFIFLTANELSICKKDGKVTFSYKFKSTVQPNILFIEKTGRGNMMVVLGTDKQLYVFDKNGLMDESIAFKGETFPVISALNDTKELFLITGSGNKLLKYTFQ